MTPPPSAPARVLVVHGPNLNLLGTREPHIYGTATLAEIDADLRAAAARAGAEVECYQSNSEGDIVTRIQEARGRFDAIVINAAAYTHTSLAIRDAITAVALPCYEVHISNTQAREEWRRPSLLGAVCVGRLEGFGTRGYRMALEATIDAVRGKGK
jgi:3-dehydroquinate dehydratase-2